MIMNCPECNSDDLWDMDCDHCKGSEPEGCPRCEGTGYIDGWTECGECGATFET